MSNHPGLCVDSATLQAMVTEDVGRFKARVDKAVREIHACRLAEGFERIYAPGEVEALRRQEYGRNGLPLNDVTVADLRRTAHDLGVDPAAIHAMFV